MQKIVFDFTVLDGDNSKVGKIISQNKYLYPDILESTGQFRILINDNTFFSEPYFPILEFLKYALEWINCPDETKEMSYSSMETEDNPLIIFKKKGEGWIVFSPWQKCECVVEFARNEVVYAILRLMEVLSVDTQTQGQTQGDG